MPKNNSLIKASAGSRRSTQKEKTRMLILDSARNLFNKSGFDKTSTRAIAKDAGVGIGTVFSHFPNKQSLLIAALLDDLSSTLKKATETLSDDVTVCDKLIHIAGYFYSYYAKKPDLSRTYLKEMWFVKGEWGGELFAQAHQFLSLLNKIFEEAIQTNEIRPEADTMLCARAFFSHYLNVLFEGLSEKEFDQGKMTDVLQSLVNQLVEGIGPHKNTQGANT
ncbi:TetR/AcrR family transcriptional regulator [Dethiosulfatarculus sandiegensis]|uniref:HTH tetR-type domain-containing protein n=1 Tax=Dethiosulfatarculus sandiegensis TaxID=1429043 RepID=A0A0D2J9X3_9BACT|nr:TetR/AcrR family transcriptional regulator [Dethiosulfatarculus sandiegensis]KIX12471.1 hypothetical protein X474_19255 [Dethiosulfatarculus sandiegensis]